MQPGAEVVACMRALKTVTLVERWPRKICMLSHLEVSLGGHRSVILYTPDQPAGIISDNIVVGINRVGSYLFKLIIQLHVCHFSFKVLLDFKMGNDHQMCMFLFPP